MFEALIARLAFACGHEIIDTKELRYKTLTIERKYETLEKYVKLKHGIIDIINEEVPPLTYNRAFKYSDTGKIILRIVTINVSDHRMYHIF